LRLSPYNFIFNNQDNINLDSLSLAELSDFVGQIDTDLVDFGKNKPVYSELIGIWSRLRKQTEKVARAKIKEAVQNG